MSYPLLLLIEPFGIEIAYFDTMWENVGQAFNRTFWN